MLPSSSSQIGRCGQINHYKKFWLLQTQLEKLQDQSSGTSLSLGVTHGNTNIPTVVKENKSLSSSLTVNGDHNTGAGHGSCRADIAGASSTSCSTSTIRGGANFPYSSNEPSTSTMKFYTHINSGNLRDSPPLSLAVNCENNVAHLNFANLRSWPSCGAPPLRHPSSTCDAPLLRPPTSANCLSSHPGNVVPRQVLVSSVVNAEDQCEESSECSTGGEKRAGAHTSSAHSCTTSAPLIINKLHHYSGLECTLPTPTTLTSLHEVPVPSSSILRSGPGTGSVLRTCSLCGTTKTPLWRSGPDGPKSLCNACGIRVKKSKRLQAAMEAAGGVQIGSSSASTPSSSYKRLQLSTTKSAGRGGALKRKHSIQAAENQSDLMYQKRKYRRNTWSPSTLAELCNQDGGLFRDAGEGTAKLVVDSKSIISNIFAKDVEEAAVLLMALSCGLVLS